MNVYAESSAILAWLLGEVEGARVQAELAKAGLVCASDLTLVECDRALHRAAREQRMSESDAASRRATLAMSAHHWALFRIGPEVVDRARRPFPVEPIRTLDAIHLATALLAQAAVPKCAVLTLDERVRRSAAELGLEVLPSD